MLYITFCSIFCNNSNAYFCFCWTLESFYLFIHSLDNKCKTRNIYMFEKVKFSNKSSYNNLIFESNVELIKFCSTIIKKSFRIDLLILQFFVFKFKTFIFQKNLDQLKLSQKQLNFETSFRPQIKVFSFIRNS